MQSLEAEISQLKQQKAEAEQQLAAFQRQAAEGLARAEDPKPLGSNGKGKSKPYGRNGGSSEAAYGSSL